jgi:hypothetical protein
MEQSKEKLQRLRFGDCSFIFCLFTVCVVFGM